MKASPQDKGREKKQKSCHINKRMYGMYIHERRNMMEAYYKKFSCMESTVFSGNNIFS